MERCLRSGRHASSMTLCRFSFRSIMSAAIIPLEVLAAEAGEVEERAPNATTGVDGRGREEGATPFVQC